MRKLRYAGTSKRDIRDIAEYIFSETFSDQLAIGTVRRLTEQCQRLAMLPGTLGRPRSELGHGVRSFPFKDYIIFFRYTDTSLDILAILHASRDIAALFGGDEG